MSYRKAKYRCGGYASSTGHCGAPDCGTCYPGGGMLRFDPKEYDFLFGEKWK